MKKELNISEILKGKPNGIRLYSPIFGDCTLSFIQGVTDAICVIANDNREFFNYKGLFTTLGEVMLFPSKLMRNWSKFAWKKGDVLVHKDGTVHIIFEGFEDDTYRTFKGKYYLWEDNGHIEQFDDHQHCMETSVFIKANDDAKTYINTIEERLGGKLNMETLEIEHAQQEFKDGDIIYCESDGGFHYPSIHILNTNCDKRRYYARLVINGRYDEAVDYDIPAFDEDNPNRLRYAIEAEKQQLFSALAKEGKAWDAEKKMIVDLNPKVELKPFDKVLIKCGKTWIADIFSHFNDGQFVCIGGGGFRKVIPYEGNESLLGTTKDVEG